MKQYEGAVRVISGASSGIWTLDVNGYNAETWNMYEEFRNEMRCALDGTCPRYDKKGSQRQVTDLIVSKIVLGVFGSVPALDTWVIKGFRKIGGRATVLTETVFDHLSSFYLANQQEIDTANLRTLSFAGDPTGRSWTRAKIIDAVLYVEGGGPLS